MKEHEQAAQVRLSRVFITATVLLALVAALLVAVSILVTRKVAHAIRRLREASVGLKAAVAWGELSAAGGRRQPAVKG